MTASLELADRLKRLRRAFGLDLPNAPPPGKDENEISESEEPPPQTTLPDPRVPGSVTDWLDRLFRRLRRAFR